MKNPPTHKSINIFMIIILLITFGSLIHKRNTINYANNKIKEQIKYNDSINHSLKISAIYLSEMRKTIGELIGDIVVCGCESDITEKILEGIRRLEENDSVIEDHRIMSVNHLKYNLDE